MQQGIVIRAQCTIFRNNLQINCKKKSKLSTIQFLQKSMFLVITGKGENQIFRFPIQKLKTIHKKFIDQGKITIQFDSQSQSKINKGFQINNQNVHSDGNFQIFVSNACKENLESLIGRLLIMKKNLLQNKQKKVHKQESKNNSIENQKNRKKPAQHVKTQQNQLKPPQYSRRNFFQLAKTSQTIKQLEEKKVSKPEIIIKNRINLLSLPKMLLRQILSFSGLHLSQRLLSKQLDEIILKNITNIKLKQEVDETTFNKLAKWAINIQGKFKNVKTLKLQDKYDKHILTKTKAKNLKFGNWKQISAKNIMQLKGLRIYSLQIPYSIKFQLSNLFGLRLVQLRLKGQNIYVRNAMVKDQDLLYLINNLQQLRKVQVSYASVKLICEIKKPEKMQQIRIGTLNRIAGFQDWFNFGKFTNLQILSIEDTQKNGVKEQHENIVLQAVFPEKIHTLELGFNIPHLSKSTIPTQLRNLKLLGTHVKNSDLRQYFLPALQNLDIIECPNLTPECLQNLLNLKVMTNWNRNQLTYASNFYSFANLNISSVKGFSYC